MATKKTNGKAPAKEQKRSSPSIAARIDYKNSKVNLSAYGLDEITEFNICCESRGGAYAIYFVFA